MSIIKSIIFFISSFIIAVIPSSQYAEGLLGQPESFFPHQAKNINDKTISRLIYKGLFKYDIYGVLIPDLAESWSISEDGLVYTIKLKDNQFWTDGTKVTSDDLIYTAFKTQTLNEVATDKVDSRTVRYTLPNKFSPFLSLLTEGVMKENSQEKYNKLSPISSGDFKVVRVKKAGPFVKEVVLSDNTGEKHISKISFKYYNSDDELLIAAKLGEIDGFVSKTPLEMENFEKFKFPIQGVYYSLLFNLRNDNFSDVEYRNKLQNVLPIEKLIGELGIPVQGAVSRSAFTNTELSFSTYDDEIIKQDLLNSHILTIPNFSAHVGLAKIIKEIWEEKLGVSLVINKVEAQKINETVIQKRNFEILLYGQEVGRDPDRYVNWHSTQTDSPGLNLSGFEHVRADRALEEGRNETDSRARLVHYREFQKVISEQVPAIFLYHPFSYHYVSKDITGIGEKYTFSKADRFLDFDNWQRIETN